MERFKKYSDEDYAEKLETFLKQVEYRKIRESVVISEYDTLERNYLQELASSYSTKITTAMPADYRVLRHSSSTKRKTRICRGRNRSPAVTSYRKRFVH